MPIKKRASEKCGSRNKSSRHHINGKHGLCGMHYRSKTPVTVLLTWLIGKFDYIDLYFWRKKKIIWLCRQCHDEFHILLTDLIKECDTTQSEEPLRRYTNEY